LSDVYGQISDKFPQEKEFLRNYFTVGKISRIFEYLELDDEEYIEAFKHIQRITGITMEDYQQYVEAASETSLPDDIQSLIGEYVVKN
jgi:hypothetical protein